MKSLYRIIIYFALSIFLVFIWRLKKQKRIPSAAKIKVCNLHPEVFSFITQAVLEGLKFNGFDVELVDDYDLTDHESIFITPCLHKDYEVPNRYIAYNWEQLQADRYWPDALFQRFNNALEIWDYSILNQKLLSEQGNKVLHILPGYNSFMADGDPVDPDVGRSDSILFFGEMSENRKPYINMLENRGIPLKLVTNGSFPSDLIMTSKVGLNVHQFQGVTLLEITRIMHMVSNKIIVISARSDDPHLDRMFEPMLTFFNDHDDLIEKYFEIISYSHEKYQMEAERRLSYLQDMPRFGQNLISLDSILWTEDA